MEKIRIKGVMAAAITPMDCKGNQLASSAIFEEYYHFLLLRQVSALLIGGTTGEGFLLTMSERKLLAEISISIIARQIPVIIHAGTNNTQETIELALHAQKAGADGVAVITPSFFHYNHSALEVYYSTVAEAISDVPLYLYNLPEFTHNEISAELLHKLLGKHPNIVGIKHSDDDMGMLQRYRRIAGLEFNLLSGDDSMEFCALSLGADGCVSGKASAFPEIPVALNKAFNVGDQKSAMQIQLIIDQLAEVIDGPPGMGLSYFKACLQHRGLNVGSVRPPLRSINNYQRSQLTNGLIKLEKDGILDLLIDHT